jgi:predicted PurR-regulated permease PerM
LILLYRTHIETFLAKLFNEKHHEKLRDIITTIKISVQSYILGLLFELLIVSGLTTLGLWIVGVKYAILLGVITGLLNLIPYIGIFTAGLLTIVASLTGSSDLSIIIGIIVVNLVVQFVDNNLLVPLVVSSKVEINSLATIVGIITSGAIAGVSGMFLAIPLMAILKVIFDRIEGLEAWGYLLGDDLPKSFKWKKTRAVTPVEKISGK